MQLIRVISILTMFFLFIPAFVFHVGRTANFPLFLFLLLVFYGLFVIVNKSRNLLISFQSLLKSSSFRLFTLLFCWICINSFIACLCGYYSIQKMLIVVLFFIFQNISVYFYPIVFLQNFINFKTFIKWYVLFFYIVLSSGLFLFICVKSNISCAEYLIDFISNQQLVRTDTTFRIRSTFAEPSHYARFITLNLPIIYSLMLSEFAIFRNKVLNKFIKYTFIPLAWGTLIFTSSPIYICFSLFITFLYFLPNILKNIIRYSFIYGLLIIVLIIFLMSPMAQKSLIMYRITNLLSIMQNVSLETLIFIEPSLATRVVNNINQILLFNEHPFFGIGFGNTGTALIAFFSKSTVPLTKEMQFHLANATTALPMTTNALCTFLYQTGIMGGFLYLLMMIQSLKLIRKCSKYFSGIEYNFVGGFFNTFLILFTISIIYEQPLVDDIHFLFYLGLVQAIRLLAIRKIE